jgi:CheY-like chemotaxis protein
MRGTVHAGSCSHDSARCPDCGRQLVVLEAARDRLEREGLRVVGVTTTSAEALRRAEELRPEVVLVDVMLGGESGFELARCLAAHHRDGGPAVILISTVDHPDVAQIDAIRKENAHRDLAHWLSGDHASNNDWRPEAPGVDPAA